MKVTFDDATWNDNSHGASSHESKRSKAEVKLLVEEVALLPGIKTQDYSGMPASLKTFAETYVWGDGTVKVIKGIHQRYDAVTLEGKDVAAEPHITVMMVGQEALGGLHVWLSETPAANQRYSWKTVGISIKVDNAFEKWPGAFTQAFDNITAPFGRKKGKARRLSVSLGTRTVAVQQQANFGDRGTTAFDNAFPAL